MMHVGEQVGKNLSISIENPNVLNIPRSTEHTLYRVDLSYGDPWWSLELLVYFIFADNIYFYSFQIVIKVFQVFQLA